MSEDPQQPATGSLTFATGGVVSGDGTPIEARIAAGERVLAQELLPGATVEVLPGTYEEFAQHAARKFLTEGVQASVMADVPDGAHVMPSGHWVVIRDAKTLTRGDKRKLLRDGQPVEGQSTAERIMTIQDLMHQMLITAWSYPYPLPSEDLDSLNRLPLADDDALDDLITEANALLFPKPPSPDQHADPNSPTAPSGE